MTKQPTDGRAAEGSLTRHALRPGCPPAKEERLGYRKTPSLRAGSSLPAIGYRKPFRPLLLVGKERDWWEAHVGPDRLLIYEISDERLILIRTGTHSDLFR